MTWIDCSRPVARSLAVTWTMPFESIAKVTSICGTPRGDGGMPTSSNLPSDLFSAASSRSPCSTWISTELWLSVTVVKISDLRVGIVALRSMSLVNRPPWVSMPSDSGVTSSSTRSLISPWMMPAWIAAPTATTSSGLMSRLGWRPKNSATVRATSGMRVCPPTRITWSICAA